MHYLQHDAFWKVFVQWQYIQVVFALGTIQVLRHQRGGWVGLPNDDVWWQGGWVGVAKWWREQKIYIISIKTYLKSIYSFEDITDQFNSSDWIFFFWKNEPELVCSVFFNKNKPCLILALFIKEKKIYKYRGFLPYATFGTCKNSHKPKIALAKILFYVCSSKINSP